MAGPQSNCAFVTYTTREAAEKAADKLHNNLVVRGMKLRLMWGRAQKTRGPDGVGGVPQPVGAMGGTFPFMATCECLALLGTPRRG